MSGTKEEDGSGEVEEGLEDTTPTEEKRVTVDSYTVCWPHTHTHTQHAHTHTHTHTQDHFVLCSHCNFFGSCVMAWT